MHYSPTQDIGNRAEILAKDYLVSQGLVFLQQQYRTRCGEIDLIMKEKNELVFVEVRYRKNAQYIDPVETISYTKQRRLIRTAQYYLQYRKWTDNVPCRFDVISILGDQPNVKITWIPNAFGVK